MIVGYNEEKLLPACFKSVSFCDDVHYTDLGSSDDSIRIAEQYANHIYHRKPVPSCEMIQTEVVHYTKNDWVIFIDPDEVVDPALAQQVLQKLEDIQANKKIGVLIVPWQFYFKGKKLKGTVWGGRNRKNFLVHKDRFSFKPVVHYGRKLNPGFIHDEIFMDNAGNNVLHHYWMRSFKGFFEKHKKYLSNEGIDRYNLGTRTTAKAVITAPIREFIKSFFTLKGYKDGLLGFFLSTFWAWYQTSALFSLYKIQKSNVPFITNKNKKNVN